MKFHTSIYNDVGHPGVGYLAIHMRIWAMGGDMGGMGCDGWYGIRGGMVMMGGDMDSPLAYKCDVATIHPPLSPCKS